MSKMTKGLIPHILESPNVFPSSDLVDNNTFLKWSKEIFKSENLTAIPRKVWVYSEEAAQMLIDQGMPPENITIGSLFEE